MNRSIVTRAGLAVSSVALGLLLLVNFRTPDDPAIVEPTDGSTTTTTGGGAATPAPGATATPSTAAGGSGGTAAGSGTFTGSLVETRYGPVQVQLTVSGGKITAVTAVELPAGGRSGQISSYVGPILSGEALGAQSAQIDLVSGATYTSSGYEQSLQAALDQAGL